MHIFNIDLHMSVVADLRQIFRAFGHTIDGKCLSNHATLVGWKQDSEPMLDGENWCEFSQHGGWEKFYDQYKQQLSEYDAFLCCFPPVFAHLYERFHKPILCHIPIRYDHGVHNNISRFEALNNLLAQPNVVLTANSIFDRDFVTNWVDAECTHIPSLCEYTGAKYTGTQNRVLCYDPPRGLPSQYVNKFAAMPRGHNWSLPASFLCAAHWPYQVSSMSIFEQYTMGMPLFFPSQRHMLAPFQEGRVLSQITNYLLYKEPSGSLVAGKSPFDPNNYESMIAQAQWIKKADYYDEQWMPHIQYFDSSDDLVSKVNAADMRAISEKMLVSNIMRKREIYKRWSKVLDKIEKMI